MLKILENHIISLEINVHGAEAYWYIEVDGKMIPKYEYYFNNMDKIEKHKHDRIKSLKHELHNASCLDLRDIPPEYRKSAIQSHIRYMDMIQTELKELQHERIKKI